MDRTSLNLHMKEAILLDEDSKKKLIKHLFGDKEVEGAGLLAAYTDEYLREYLERMNKESLEKILKEFKCYSSSRNADEEEKETVDPAGVKPGISVGSTSGFENGLTGGLDLDCHHEEIREVVSSDSEYEHSVEVQNPVDDNGNVVDDHDNVDSGVNVDGDGYQVNGNIHDDDNDNISVAGDSDDGNLEVAEHIRRASERSSSEQEDYIIFQELQQTKHDKNAFYRTLNYFHKELKERKEENEKLKKVTEDTYQELQQTKHDKNAFYRTLNYFHKMLGKSQEENRALRRENQELKAKEYAKPKPKSM